MSQTISIDGRLVGPGAPAYIIAEMSANHHHDFDRAVDILRAAKEAGADAIKLQTYRPETMTLDAPQDHFRVAGGTLWDGRSLYDLYAEAHTPWEWQPRLKKLASDLGLHLFSTPFDASAVDFLEAMNVPAYKIASFELVDLPLIEKVARTGKPIILSTGMGNLEEIGEAVQAARSAGASELVLLKCTSAYPSLPEDANLRTIQHLAATFGVPAGLSDHTMGIAVPVAAVALGACVVEKHFTLSRAIPGPDSTFSLEPHEFKEMVNAIRVAEKALGQVRYGSGDLEKPSQVFRRSLFVVRDMKAGEAFTADNVRCIRPGNGLAPKHLGAILGHRATRDIKRGTPLAWELIVGADARDAA